MKSATMSISYSNKAFKGPNKELIKFAILRAIPVGIVGLFIMGLVNAYVPISNILFLALSFLLVKSAVALTMLVKMVRSYKEANQELKIRTDVLRVALRDQRDKSLYDGLTGFPSHNLIADRFSCAVVNARRNGGYIGVYIVDIDDMEHIESLYGADAAISLSLQVAERLRLALRTTDSIMRKSKSSFLLLVGSVDDSINFNVANKRLMTSLSQKFNLGGEHPVRVNDRVARAIYPSDGTTFGQLIALAEIRLKSGDVLKQLYDDEAFSNDGTSVWFAETVPGLLAKN